MTPTAPLEKAAFERSRGATRERRGGLSFTVIAVGFVFSIGLAFAVAVALYDKYVAYEHVAAKHLPRDTRFAARIDIEKVVLFEPFRKHLLPLFDAAYVQPERLKPRHDRLRAHTGVELGRDLREIVVAFGAHSSDWVVAFGGKFPRTGMVDGFRTVFAEEGRLEPSDADTVVLPGAGVLGQAVDGALIVASTVGRLREALAGSGAYLDLGLSPAGPGSVAVRADAGVSELGLAVAPGQRILGELRLGQGADATLALHFNPGLSQPAALGLTRNAAALAALGPAAAALGGPLAAATVGDDLRGGALVTIRWQRSELDQAAAWLAKQAGFRPTQAPRN